MRTRKRGGDIFLDFTSLLDITLIILFFFIMFSSFSTGSKTREAEERAEKAIAAADEKMQQAEKREAEAAERIAAMQAELDELKRTSGDSANRTQGISEFASGENMKLIYSAENGYWKFEVRRGEQTVLTIDRTALLRRLMGYRRTGTYSASAYSFRGSTSTRATFLKR